MIESIFYVLCTTIPSHLIAFSLYWDYPWRSKKLAMALVIINVLCKMIAMACALYYGWNAQGIELLFSLSGAAIYFLMIDADRFKLVFTYVLIVDYLMVVRGIASFSGTYFLSTGYQSWKVSIICILLYALTLPWMLHFFRETICQVFRINAPALWRVIWLPPALTTIVVLLYTNPFDAAGTLNWKAFGARLSLLGCTIAVYHVLLQALEEFRSRAVLEEKDKQNRHILLLQRAQYANLQSHMEEIRRARHDLRQHQRILLSFLDSGDMNKLRTYIKSQTSSLPTNSLHQYCKNYAVNLLLNHYAGQYSGTADFRWKDGMFLASVFLTLPENGNEAAKE